MENLWNHIKENKTVALTLAAGGLIGGVGGFMLGGATLAGAAYAIGLGAVGLAAGGVGGHFLNRSIDKSTPAPMGGMRAVEETKIEPQGTGTIAVKPSVQLTDDIASSMETRLRNHPQYDRVAPYMGAIKQALSYGRMELDLQANEDGTRATVRSANFSAPGTASYNVPTYDISVPLRDGKIDQESPEAKAAMRKILTQAIDRQVPPEFREAARDALNDLLSANMPALKIRDASSITGDELLRTELAGNMIKPSQMGTGNPDNGLSGLAQTLSQTGRTA